MGHKAYGKTHQYYPLISKEKYTRFYLNNMIKGYFNGSFQNLVSFFARENKMDVNDLEKLVNEIKKQKYMTGYLNYAAEANLDLILFLCIYLILLRNETNFILRRTYLLTSMVASLLFPLLEITDAATTAAAFNESYVLPHIVLGGEELSTLTAGRKIHVWEIAFWMYLTITSLLLIRFLYHAVKLISILRSSPYFIFNGTYKIFEPEDTMPSFSFFRYIIIGNAAALEEFEREQILRHEIVHARMLHSIDILLAEIVCIIFWFNPATRIIKKMISDVHEFQADEKTAEHRDLQAYCSLLAKISLQSAGFTITNHFNKSLTLKRIIMLKSIKKKTAPWKLALIVPFVGIFFFFTACQDQVMEDINEITQSSTMVLDMPPAVQTRVDALQKEHPNAKFVVSEITSKESMGKVDELANKYGGKEKMTSIEVLKDTESEDDNRGFVIIGFNETISQIAEASVSEGDVFTLVEESAHPKTSMQDFFQFVHSNITLPEEVKARKISGKVFIEFIVEKDGSFSNLKVLRGMGHGCDEEALRVLSSAPDWIPGKHKGVTVRQKFVLPILFQYEGPLLIDLRK